LLRPWKSPPHRYQKAQPSLIDRLLWAAGEAKLKVLGLSVIAAFFG